MDLVHLYLEESANEVRKLGAEFVFGGPEFRDAAERYTVDEIVDLYLKFREVSQVPEDYWREEFIRVFSRGRDAIPPVDWEQFRWDYGLGVFEAIDRNDPDWLRGCDAHFRKNGFRLSRLSFSHSEFTEVCRSCYPEWVAINPNENLPEHWTPPLFAERIGQPQMLTLLHEFDAAG